MNRSIFAAFILFFLFLPIQAGNSRPENSLNTSSDKSAEGYPLSYLFESFYIPSVDSKLALQTLQHTSAMIATWQLDQHFPDTHVLELTPDYICLQDRWGTLHTVFNMTGDDFYLNYLELHAELAKKPLQLEERVSAWHTDPKKQLAATNKAFKARCPRKKAVSQAEKKKRDKDNLDFHRFPSMLLGCLSRLALECVHKPVHGPDQTNLIHCGYMARLTGNSYPVIEGQYQSAVAKPVFRRFKGKAEVARRDHASKPTHCHHQFFETREHCLLDLDADQQAKYDKAFNDSLSKPVQMRPFARGN